MTNDQFNQLLTLESKLQSDQSAAAATDAQMTVLNGQLHDALFFDVLAAQQKVAADAQARIEQARANRAAGFAAATVAHTAVNDDNAAIQSLLTAINTPSAKEAI